MPPADMQRIALPQADVRQRKTVLEHTHAMAEHVAVIIIQAASKRVGAHPVTGFYGLFNLQANTCKRIIGGYTQSYFLTITARRSNRRHTERYRIVLFQPVNRRGNELVEHPPVATSGNHQRNISCYTQYI